MLKYSLEKNVSEKSEIITHDLNKYDSLGCRNLKDVYEKIKNYDIIGVDDGQFFSDLVEISEELALNNITILF